MEYKNIKRGILASTRPAVNTILTLYTCPVGKQAEVIVYAYNEHSGAVVATVGLTKKGESTSRPIFVKSMTAGTTEAIPNSTGTKVFLNGGDSIQITADTANKLNVVANGIEFTVS